MKFRLFCGGYKLQKSSKKIKEPFESLPDEMVVQALSLVDADTLLGCRLVCKRWRQLVDAYVFQEKASRENESANNGRGYHSFSQIDRQSVRKLDMPWYVFYAICKHDPFNRNLVKNHCGQNQYKYWDRTYNKNGELNWWIIEQRPQGAPDLPDDPDFEKHTSCFVSTYTLCSKQQEIVLKNYGLNDSVMNLLQPDILVSEWYSGHFDCSSQYELRASIYDKNDKLIVQHNYNDILPQWQVNNWTKASHTFKNQSSASHLVLSHSGKDTQYWAGHYGSKISGSVVKVLLPIKFKCVSI